MTLFDIALPRIPCDNLPVTDTLDRFYTLTPEELRYKVLWEQGKLSSEALELPEEIEAMARIEGKTVLSRGWFTSGDEGTVAITKHPTYMPRYLHSHRFVEMTYVLSGKIEEEVEGVKVSVEEGECVFILPGFFHSVWAEGDGTVAINFIVESEFFARLDSRFGLGLSGLRWAVSGRTDLSREIALILSEASSDSTDARLMREVIFERCLLKVKRAGKPRAGADAEKRNEAYRIMSYLEANFSTATLTSFAEHFSITEQYASRLIKEKTGKSFSAIIRKLRMEEAAMLLRKPNLSSKEVSYLVGYSSPEHFSRTFKDWFGKSPDEWRKTRFEIER